MKSYLPSSILVTAFSVILFSDLFQDASAFMSSGVGIALTKAIFYPQDPYHRLYVNQPSSQFPIQESPASSSPDNKERVSIASDNFLKEYFQSEIDDVNLPPSMSILHRSIRQLALDLIFVENLLTIL